MLGSRGKWNFRERMRRRDPKERKTVLA